MKKKGSSQNFPDGKRPKAEMLGYPLDPPTEDIYKNAKKVDKDMDELSSEKKLLDQGNSQNVMGVDFETDASTNDLDVPGAELDDAQEEIGSEDEENNYYSQANEDQNASEENN